MARRGGGFYNPTSMRVTLNTRKPVERITREDLRAFPVWTFATNEEGIKGRDESWIRPLKTKVLAGDYEDTLLVAAEFRTPRAEAYEGFMSVWVDEVYAGALVGNHGYLPLPHELPARQRKEILRAVKAGKRDFFPLRYRLKVLFRGGRRPREGLVP